jgi:hypothetical protein
MLALLSLMVSHRDQCLLSVSPDVGYESIAFVVNYSVEHCKKATDVAYLVAADEYVEELFEVSLLGYVVYLRSIAFSALESSDLSAWVSHSAPAL